MNLPSPVSPSPKGEWAGGCGKTRVDETRVTYDPRLQRGHET